MTERAESRTARRSEAAETPDGPVFVDPSGRRRRRARVFSGLALGAIAIYLGLVATAFLGGPDIVTPLLPRPPATANDAARQVPAVAPSPTAVPSAVPEESTPPTPPSAEAVDTEPTTSPSTAPVEPAATEPAADEPGKSEEAPGKPTITSSVAPATKKLTI